MGDMSKCSHGGHRGYCDLCNPIEADLRKELPQAEARVLALETALHNARIVISHGATANGSLSEGEEKCLEQIDTALLAVREAGYVIVPREPTKEMQHAPEGGGDRDGSERQEEPAPPSAPVDNREDLTSMRPAPPSPPPAQGACCWLGVETAGEEHSENCPAKIETPVPAQGG